MGGGGEDRDWIAAALARRGSLVETDAWRVLHRGEHPERDCAVERYRDWLSLQAYEETEAPDVLRDGYRGLVEGLLRETGCRGCLVRFANRNPHQRKLVRDAYWVGSPPDGRFVIVENALRFEIELAPERHPGLFLDQRETRQRVRAAAAGLRVANLFAYTCSFSVAAAVGGAREVVSIDLAAGCLDTGRRNLAANLGAAGCSTALLREDVRKWLERQLRRVDRDGEASCFDLVICDPPVFAAGGKRGRVFSVDAEWGGLIRGVAGILRQGGIAVFANNHRSAGGQFYEAPLRDHFAVVDPLPLPVDFEIAGPPHSRTWWCRL